MWMFNFSDIIAAIRRLRGIRCVRWGGAYLVAVLLTFLFFALRLSLQGITENRPMMIMFILPVCVSAYAGGIGPGIVATLISALLTSFYLIAPVNTFAMGRSFDHVQMAVFIFTGVVISMLSESLRKMRRKAAELPLLQGQLSVIAETMPGSMYVFRRTPDGIVRFVEPGPGLVHLTGVAEKELQHDAAVFMGRIPEFERTLIVREMTNSAERLTPWHRVFPYQHPERGEVWLETWSCPKREIDQSVVWSGLMADVTSRKNAEQSLRASEELYRMYVEQSPVAIMVTNMEGRYIDGNPAAQRIFGFSTDEMKRMHVADLVHEDERGMAMQHFQRAVSSGVAEGEFRMRHKDGHFNRLMVVAKPIPGDRVLGYCVDVSAWRRAEELALLQGTALQAAANAIVITDASGRIEWVNPAFTALSGYTAGEAIGRNHVELLNSFEQDASIMQQLYTSMETGQMWQGELVSRRKDGSIYEEEITITPVRDETGAIRHFVAVEQDVSSRKMIEKQLLRTQRLESVGRLASGIAHDLNNILAPVLAAPDLLRDAVKDPELLSLIDSIENSANRGAAIVRQLLTFGRGSDVGRISVSLRPVASEMIRLMNETFPRNITARLDAAPEVMFVHGDPTQIHQLIMNLCVNARDAMPGGGSIQIRVERVDVSHRQCAAYDWVSPGAFVMMTVSDTGTGIPPEILGKIFDPFFTTKPTGEGTGLGLSTAMGIARNHGGFIEVDSRVGHGSSFRVYLPMIAPHDSGEVVIRTDSPLPAGNQESVLMVDDESSVRKVLGEVLRRAGYQVSFATNGAEAMEILKEHHHELKLLITDMMMPVMDGWQLIQNVREQWPNIKVIAISGNLPEAEWLEQLRSKVDDLILKPCTKETLLRTVWETLNRA